MASQGSSTKTTDRTTPIACTLSRAGLATQARRWRRLAGRALVERAETADGLRLRFRDDPGVADALRRLVAVETDCCSWADWTVHNDAGQLVLTVRSAGDGVAALHAMFGELRPAAQG